MENKKLRIGLISENPLDANKLKLEYPDTYVTHARNVIELHRQAGQNTFNAVVFLNLPEIKKDLFSFHQFLRQKKEFQNLPIAILSSDPVLLSKPFQDPMVRTFKTESNLFMPLLNFFNSLQKEGKLSQLVTQSSIETDFSQALGEKLGKDTQFFSRAALSDETHESFICQLSDEICTHLLWIKFSARILETGSQSLKKMLNDPTESELQQYMENLLKLVFEEFNSKLNLNLDEAGALRFIDSEKMEGKDKVPYIKAAKSFPLIFESNICSILLETIRYI